MIGYKKMSVNNDEMVKALTHELEHASDASPTQRDNNMAGAEPSPTGRKGEYIVGYDASMVPIVASVNPVPASVQTLPKDSPVSALGYYNGTYYYCAANGELRGLQDKDHQRLRIKSLFIPDISWVESRYPVWATKPVEVNGAKVILPRKGADYERLESVLMHSATLKGIWDPIDKVRDIGAYPVTRGKVDHVLLHEGDYVLHLGNKRPRKKGVGLQDSYFYQKNTTFLPPIHGENPSHKILNVLKSWNYGEYNDLYARLILGWICQGFFAGALPTRSMMWVVGDKGTGKSTLGDFVATVLDKRIISSASTTVAGITQPLGNKRVSVKLDDFINKHKKDDKLSDIMEIIKVAHTGDIVRRGSSEGIGKEYSLFSAFWCSTVSIPGEVGGEVLSRMVIARLRPFVKKNNAPFSIEQAREWGCQLFGHLIDNWQSFDYALKDWRFYITENGGSDRQADVIGTLLAFSDVALLGRYCKREEADSLLPAVVSLINQASEDAVADWVKILDIIGQYQPKIYIGGNVWSVSKLVHDACIAYEDLEVNKKTANDSLETVGLKVVKSTKFGTHEDGTPVSCLAIPKGGNIPIGDAFNDTEWRGVRGGGSPWFDILTRSPHIIKLDNAQSRETVMGKRCYCVYIPVANILGYNPLEKDNDTDELV